MEERNQFKPNTYGLVSLKLNNRNVIEGLIDFVKKNPEHTMFEMGIDYRLTVTRPEYLFNFKDVYIDLYYNRTEVEIDESSETFHFAHISSKSYELNDEQIEILRERTEDAIPRLRSFLNINDKLIKIIKKDDASPEL